VNLPLCNHTGRLEVKHQITYFLTPLSKEFALILSTADALERKTRTCLFCKKHHFVSPSTPNRWIASFIQKNMYPSLYNIYIFTLFLPSRWLTRVYCDRFIGNLLKLLVFQNEKFGAQIQKHVKELVGHELNPALYPSLFDQIKVCVDKFFDATGQVRRFLDLCVCTFWTFVKNCVK